MLPTGVTVMVAFTELKGVVPGFEMLELNCTDCPGNTKLLLMAFDATETGAAVNGTGISISKLSIENPSWITDPSEVKMNRN